jgi:hypothetical protein
MADVTINGLGALATPASDDYIPVWDSSAGTTLKIRRDTFVGGIVTGGGTLATAGYTLTLASSGALNLGGFTLAAGASGTAALSDVATTFTAAPTFSSDINVRTHSASNLWSIDAANGAGSTLADTATLSLSGDGTFQGLVMIGSTVDGQVGLFMVGGGVVAEVADGGGTYSNTKDTGSSTNVYFEGGTYLVQNKTGVERTYTIFSIRLRPGA